MQKICFAAASEASKTTAQLCTEAKLLQFEGIANTQREHLQSEKDKDRGAELKRLEMQEEEFRVRGASIQA